MQPQRRRRVGRNPLRGDRQRGPVNCKGPKDHRQRESDGDGGEFDLQRRGERSSGKGLCGDAIHRRDSAMTPVRRAAGAGNRGTIRDCAGLRLGGRGDTKHLRHQEDGEDQESGGAVFHVNKVNTRSGVCKGGMDSSPCDTVRLLGSLYSRKVCAGRLPIGRKGCFIFGS